jgi:predicted lipid-binding transport protein (Tim44 family)
MIHQCQLCDYKSSYKQNYNRHIKTCKGKTYEEPEIEPQIEYDQESNQPSQSIDEMVTDRLSQILKSNNINVQPETVSTFYNSFWKGSYGSLVGGLCIGYLIGTHFDSIIQIPQIMMAKYQASQLFLEKQRLQQQQMEMQKQALESSEEQSKEQSNTQPILEPLVSLPSG